MTQILTVLIPAIPTALVSLVGILLSNKLTVYRIEQLEKKMDKHNNVIERMVVVEQSLKSAHHRIDDMERK